MTSPELSFRLAVPADAEVLADLVQSAYRGDSSRAGWTTEADLLDDQRITPDQVAAIIAAPDGVVLVIEDEQDEIVGCCQLEHRADDRAYFGLFAVSPYRQAGGLGRRILAEAELYARTRWNATTMEMQVIGQRDDLIAWYLRRGYTRTEKTRPFPYQPGEPAARDDLYFVVLEKALTD